MICLRQVCLDFNCAGSSLANMNISGGSASAAGSLVKQLGGTLLGYIFIMELGFLNGRAKLEEPVFTLLKGQDE
jgi:hypothetical protein